ncbi:hypothetical protein RJD24_10395 [Bacillaceae bacterium IKA-2]|nr:hypothetical protein RJD24_10395 [Bacillaceae bacterium IKA-2]
MKENDHNSDDSNTVAGTNIDEVKRQNENSGLTYNQAKELLAKTLAGKDEQHDSLASLDYTDEGS